MILEFRTYRLRPGATDEFVRLMSGESAELLKRHGIRVVASGVSLVPESEGLEEAYLIRAFASLEERDRQEMSFYSSTDWVDGPRKAVLECIESYHTIVLEVPDEAVRALERSGTQVSPE
ncbi:MAG: NIPSNAP family protein [Actinobacteria bacterium]|nr:NIPSNAP family protein [Actinomycetota bacterium]